MVAVVLGLGASVVIERVKVIPGCFQSSISAYYYTPVRGVFVGALVALGICLICLRGSTDIEDLLLNVAGMLTPVVAFVPTPGYTPSCTSVSPPVEHVSANVANNVVALLIMSGIALLIAGSGVISKKATLPARIGGAVGALLWVTTLLVFLSAQDAFVDNAHDVAAVLMFLCIVGAAGSRLHAIRAARWARLEATPFPQEERRLHRLTFVFDFSEALFAPIPVGAPSGFLSGRRAC